MRHRFGKTIVVALGGSVVYPGGIDAAFLKKFAKLARKFLKRKKKFVVVVGGGRLARLFQEAAGKVLKVTDEDKDWIGIHATRLNAHLLRTVFRDVADPVVFDSRKKRKKLLYPVTVASGWRPGWSTDYVASQIAADLGVREVVVAGKPDFVYDRDFTKFKSARPLRSLTWREYRKLIPRRWRPGMSAPVDPVAARLASRKRISALIVSGKDLRNLENLLRGREFRGTVIS